MRLLHRNFLLLLSVAIGLSGAAFSAQRAARPNIIFVLTDDFGYGDLGSYGGQFVPTPNLDRMAREGIRFTQFQVASPICSPSRTGATTGMFPARWRITSYLQTRKGNAACGQADFLDARAPSVARLLKSSGYATAHIGKWHMGGGRDVTNAPSILSYGFDECVSTWESPNPHPDITATNWIWSAHDKVKRWDRTALFVNKTLDFLRRHPDQPCYVNLWPDDTHTPFVPSPELKASIRRLTIPPESATSKPCSRNTTARWAACLTASGNSASPPTRWSASPATTGRRPRTTSAAQPVCAVQS